MTLIVPDGAFVFPPDPHYGGTGAVARVEEFPRLFASQQGYALPRPRNVEPPVLRTAPMGHGERFPRDPFCRRAPEKRKSHFPLTPITGEPALSRMLRLFHRFADRLPRKLPDRKLSGVPWQIPQALSPVKRSGGNRITVRSSRAREDCSIRRQRRLACRI